MAYKNLSKLRYVKSGTCVYALETWIFLSFGYSSHFSGDLDIYINNAVEKSFQSIQPLSSEGTP